MRTNFPHFAKYFLALLALIALLAAPAPARADITIALAGPLSGTNADVGAEWQTGMEAAIKDLNDGGGVLHQKLALTTEDDACDTARAVAAATRLVDRGVHFVFGHFCSAATLMASSIYAENGTLEITTSTNPTITQQGFDGLFRLTGRDDQQGRMLADYMSDHFAGKRVAILADHSILGTSLAASVRSELARQGRVTVTFDQSIDAGTRNFATVLGQLEQSKTEIVAFAGYPLEAGLLIRQAVEAGLKIQFLSGSTLVRHQFWDIAGDSAEGTLFTFVADADALPNAHDVVERLRTHGHGAQGYTLYAYAAVQLFADAITRAGSLEPDAVDRELQKGGIPTVLGDISFNEFGDNATPNWRVYRWSKGQILHAE